MTAIRKKQEKSFDNKNAGKEAYIPEDLRENLPDLALSLITTLVSLHYGRYIPRLYNTLKTSMLGFIRYWIFFLNEDDKKNMQHRWYLEIQMGKNLSLQKVTCGNILVIGKFSF